MRNKLLYINLFLLLIAVIFLGLFIFRDDIRTLIKKPLCKNCNVILISLDTLGANHLPCYGYERNTAPNLCNFAKNNVFFTNAFSNASWTLPSHFSIFTSQYPNHHKMINDDDTPLDPNINMMAEFFKKANYKTIYVAPLTSRSLPISRGIGRGFEMTLDTESTQSLINWDKGISQLIKNNKNKQKTFLFLHTYWVHYPYVVKDMSEKNKRMYTKDFYEDIPLNLTSYTKFSQEFLDFIINLYETRLKEDNPADKKNNQYVLDSLKRAKNLKHAEKIYKSLITDVTNKRGNWWGNWHEFYLGKIARSDEKISYSRALYDEMIFYLDKKLAMIFDLVSNSELANNTIIIITSDHGEGFMEHGSMAHPADSLYNETTNVVLTMYIPKIKQKRINDLVQSIDILPTVLNLTGVNYSANNFDGIDLTGSILGQREAKKNQYLISEGPNIDTIRDNKWKLYVRTNHSDDKLKYELFHLKNDPSEINNLSQKIPSVVKKLQDDLNKIIYKK